MPWTAHYVSDGVYTAFTGHTTGQEVVAAVRDFFAHGYERDPRFALFDFTLADRFDVQPADVEEIAAIDLDVARRGYDVVIAVVAPATVQYGLSRMWQIRVEPTQWRTTVVTTLEEALRWLEEQGVDTSRLALPHRPSPPPR